MEGDNIKLVTYVGMQIPDYIIKKCKTFGNLW